MLRYNTKQPRLALPEYGRAIQQMVDRCLEVEDKAERTRAAHAVIDAMGRLFPEMRQTEASQHKLWDHLALMSGFKLDIDWPVEPAKPDDFGGTALKVAYPSARMQKRLYGAAVEQLAARVAAMEPSDERDELINQLANQMKKLALAQNPDADVDASVMRDLAELTHGAIRLRPGEYVLNEYEIVAPVTGKKRKRKK